MPRSVIRTSTLAIGAVLIFTLIMLSWGNIPQSVSAQIDPTSQQQTLDAMVAQMFAQAQTATAQAAGGAVISTATPVPAEVTPDAAAIIVNSLADDPRGCPRNCTLRSAIAAAQPGDTITFDPALTGVIALSQQITIDKDLAIAGIAVDQIIIDGANVQFDLITIARDVHVHLSRLTFRNAEAMPQTGSYQAALVNAGTLSLADVRFEQAVLRTSGRLEAQNVTFTSNRAAPMLVLDGGANAVVRESTFSNASITSPQEVGYQVSACVISNSGTLELTRVQIENNRCGGESSYVIAHPAWSASLTINESTLQNNSSAKGISAAGTVTISRTTLSANGDVGITGTGQAQVQISDSLITGHRNGAIILTGSGSWIISNSTIAGNVGQAITGRGAVTVTNSTITANGGGVIVEMQYANDGLVLSSSIVAGNRGSADLGGVVSSLGNNLIGHPGDTTGWFASDILNADPQLAPLGDYGGTTQTMALYEGSPAIGAGYCLGDGDIPAVTTDQRGVARKDPCDIGAYEIEPGNMLVAPTATPTPTATITPTLQPTFTPTPATMGLFRMVPSESLVRFTILGDLRGVETPAVGTTNEVEGEVVLDFAHPANTRVSTIRINARALATDNEFRDRAIRDVILESDRDEYQFIDFTPTAITGLPSIIHIGEAISFQITGDLKIREIVQSVTFDVTATAVTSTRIEGAAQTTVTRSQFGLTIPSVPGVGDVAEEVMLEIEFVAEAASSSDDLSVPSLGTSDCLVHSIVAGDTPGAIAEQYGVSIFDLLRANQLTEENAALLQIGQELVIPTESCVLGYQSSIPDPTLISTAQASEGPIVTVLLSNTTLRSGPGTNNDAVVQANNGEQFPVVDSVGEGSSLWYEVRLPDGSTAWVWSRSVTLSGDETDIGASSNESSVNGTATPEPTRTTVSGISGRWEGEVNQPSYGTYSTILELVNCRPTEVCGEVEYPDFSCGGEVTLLSIDDSRLELFEDITYGNCIDETILLELVSGDQWRARYIYQGTELASAALTASNVTGFDTAVTTRDNGSPQTRVTENQLVGTTWEFGRSNGTVIATRLTLEANSEIAGHYHYNESSWGIDDEDVVTFYTGDGAPSTRFTVVTEVNELLLLRGRFLLERHPRSAPASILIS